MTPSPTERPTHARHTVIAFAVTLAILSYVSRVCISQAAAQKPTPLHPSTLVSDLHLSAQQLGWIFGAFGISYALFEIPTGWLGDWLGPRRVLMRIVVWWSVFTAASGWMWSAASLWVVRFLFGAGEAGGFPNLTKVFTTWLPRTERLRAQAIMWTFARLGGAFTPPLVVLLFVWLNWRWVFVVFGAVGIIWAVLFYGWFRDDPRRHPGVNAAEAAIIGDAHQNAAGHGNVPWLRLVSSGSVWLLWLQYFCLSYSWCFFITWLPNYLKAWNLTDRNASLLAVMPLLCGAVGCTVCGAFSPWLLRRLGGDLRKSRRLSGAVGLMAAGVFYVLATQAHSAVWAVVALGLASFANDLTIPPAWAACMDIGGHYAGTVSGSMNMMGNFGTFLGPTMGGWLVHDFMNRAGYNVFLWLMAAVYVVGAVSWLFIDPVTPLDPDAATTELAAAIAREAARFDHASLKKAVAAVSARYRGEGPRVTGRPSDVERAAYLVVRVPAIWGALRMVFEELRERMPGGTVRSLLDLGAGPGTASWAATGTLPDLAEITCVEQNRDFIALARTLGGREARWMEADLRSAKLPAADLVVLSYAAGEVEGAEALIDRAWSAASVALIVVEPGTPRGFATIRAARERLIAAGAHIAAPCPHANACPMQDPDWCHFAARIERSRLHRQLKGGELAYEDEKFSYVIASRVPAAAVASRIVRHPWTEPGLVRLELCGREGLASRTVRKRTGELFRSARKARLGGEWSE